jgi:DNA-directed RNA polymerase II subunit RPB2
VVWDMRDKELRLQCDAGRCCRPLFVVEDRRLKIRKSDIKVLQERSAMTPHGTAAGGDARSIASQNARWSDIVQKGFIEYIDCDEAETTMVAMSFEDLTRSRHDPKAYSQTYTHCEIHPSVPTSPPLIASSRAWSDR